MATKSFTRNIVIEDNDSISKFKTALKSDVSNNLKSSIKDIEQEEHYTKSKVLKSILGKY